MACRRPPSRVSYCSKSQSKRKRRRGRSRKKKSCRPGKVTRNPFLNYLRWYRKTHCGLNMIQVAVEGAKCWCKMSDQQRKKFYAEACKAPKMRRRKGGCGRSRSRSRRRKSRSRRRKSRSRSRRSRSRGSCGGGSRRKKRRARRKSRSGCRSGCSQPRRVYPPC